MLQNSKISGVQPCKFARNWVQNPVYSSALCNNIFVRIWIFLSTSFEKGVLEPFEPLERFARGFE